MSGNAVVVLLLAKSALLLYRVVVSERILDVFGKFGAVLLGWLTDGLCDAAGEDFLVASGAGFVRDGRSGRVGVGVVESGTVRSVIVV